MFDKICSFENLYSAYLKSRKCKRYKKEILKFGFYAEENLLKLKEQLQRQTYRHAVTANLLSTIPKEES